jgi:hypothetical protein
MKNKKMEGPLLPPREVIFGFKTKQKRKVLKKILFENVFVFLSAPPPHTWVEKFPVVSMEG